VRLSSVRATALSFSSVAAPFCSATVLAFFAFRHVSGGHGNRRNEYYNRNAKGISRTGVFGNSGKRCRYERV